MCYQAFFIIQRLDTGEFVGCDDGDLVWYINMARARTFQSLENALNYAADIEPDHDARVTVHTIYLPCNYNPQIL
jgi:hypothetical protein